MSEIPVRHQFLLASPSSILESLILLLRFSWRRFHRRYSLAQQAAYRYPGPAAAGVHPPTAHAHRPRSRCAPPRHTGPHRVLASRSLSFRDPGPAPTPVSLAPPQTAPTGCPARPTTAPTALRVRRPRTVHTNPS